MDIKEITWFEVSNLKCTATLDLQNCGSVVFSIIEVALTCEYDALLDTIKRILVLVLTPCLDRDEG